MPLITQLARYKTIMRKAVLPVLAAILAAVALSVNAQAATTQLPPGEVCFQQATGPVSSGSLNMYYPGTLTPKTNWKDSLQSAANTQPIQLDAAGCAVIFGVGSYRQQLYSGPVVGGVTTGNLIFDLVTTDTSAYNSIFWAGLSAGTNTITVVDPGFNGTDGTIINFIALNSNTGPATLNPSGFGNVPILQPTTGGPIPLTANCITANNPVGAIYSTVQSAFLLQAQCPASSSTAVATTPTPQGYLTLSSDVNNVIVNSDITAATALYYSPYVGNQVPIWNGSGFTIYTFPKLTLTLTGSFTGSTAFDACIFLNSGVPQIAAMPAWSASTGVSAARAATIQRVNGIWVNTGQITGTNGANTYTIPAEQCTVVGSFFTDTTAGQVSDYVTWGASRKWATYNFYNRALITLQVGDSTSSWGYTTATIRPSNNATTNSLITFVGLPEETTSLSFTQYIVANNTNSQTTFGQIGIGYNSTTAFSGTTAAVGDAFSSITSGTYNINVTTVASYQPTPVIGAQTITSLETIAGTQGATFFGTQSRMLLLAQWRG